MFDTAGTNVGIEVSNNDPPYRLVAKININLINTNDNEPVIKLINIVIIVFSVALSTNPYILIDSYVIYETAINIDIFSSLIENDPTTMPIIRFTINNTVLLSIMPLNK